MGWLALVALHQGREPAFAAVAGVTVGLVVYMLAAAFGLAEIFERIPVAYEALRWAGILFLLWLAYEVGFQPPDSEPGGASEIGGSATSWRAFQRGLGVNLLNPKAAVFYLTLLPSFVQVGHASPLNQALVLGSIHILVSVAVHCGIVLGADRARPLRENRSFRWAHIPPGQRRHDRADCVVACCPDPPVGSMSQSSFMRCASSAEVSARAAHVRQRPSQPAGDLLARREPDACRAAAGPAFAARAEALADGVSDLPPWRTWRVGCLAVSIHACTRT